MGAREVILLDGGTGTELRERGVEVPCHRTSIWSAHALIAAPDEVVAVHREYIEAGARVVTACNYAVTPTLLAREGMEGRLEELSVLAVELARRAADESGEDVRVAASLMLTSGRSIHASQGCSRRGWMSSFARRSRSLVRRSSQRSAPWRLGERSG